MTYEQACELAWELNEKNETYPAIAKRLKQAGYLSPRTKAPVKSGAVRHMVIAHCNLKGVRFKGANKSFPPKKRDKFVPPPPSSFAANVEAIVAMNVSNDAKVRMISALTDELLKAS